jgi:predicted Zn-dependent protease
MLSGDYQGAIGTLNRALAAAPHGSLTYAYALYDLGRSLVLSGNPQAAIPILQQRLQIPNQTATVQALLNQAEQAAGQSSGQNSQSGGAALPGKGHDKNKHGGG